MAGEEELVNQMSNMPAQPVRMDEDLSSLDSLVKFDVSAILPIGLDVDPTDRIPKLAKKPKKAGASSKSLKPIVSMPDDKERPPYSYSDLIELALCDKGNLAVRDVYKWIIENFAFYRNLEYSKWKPSVRHTLTISRRFKKVNRCRGGYLWGIAPEADRKQAKQKNHWKKVKIAEYQKTSVKRKRAPRENAGDDDVEEEDVTGMPYGRYPLCYPTGLRDEEGRWTSCPWPGRWRYPMMKTPGEQKEGPLTRKRRPLPPWYCYQYPYAPMPHPSMALSPYRLTHPFFWGSDVEEEDSGDDNDEDFGTWGLYSPYEKQGGDKEASTTEKEKSNTVQIKNPTGNESDDGDRQTWNQQASTLDWNHPRLYDYMGMPGIPSRARLPPSRGKHLPSTTHSDTSSLNMGRPWDWARLCAPAMTKTYPHTMNTADTRHDPQAALKTQLTPFLSDVALGHDAPQEWHSRGDPPETLSVAPLESQQPPLFAASAHTLLDGMPGSPPTASSGLESQPECPVPAALMLSMSSFPLALSPPSDNELFINVSPEPPTGLKDDLHTPDAMLNDPLRVDKQANQSTCIEIRPILMMRKRYNVSPNSEKIPESCRENNDGDNSVEEIDKNKKSKKCDILHVKVENGGGGGGGDNPLATQLLAMCANETVAKPNDTLSIAPRKMPSGDSAGASLKPHPCSSDLRSTLRDMLTHRPQTNPSTGGKDVSKRATRRAANKWKSRQHTHGDLQVSDQDVADTVAEMEQATSSSARGRRPIVLPARYRSTTY